MSIAHCVSSLRSASKQLETQWSSAQMDWHDENSRNLDEQVIQPLLATIRSAEQAMVNLDTSLIKMLRDCAQQE